MLFTVLADRPAVPINQLGYLPDGPKRATWVTDAAVPVEFIIEAADRSSATLHLAATGARGARLFSGIDPAYAVRLLAAARTAYDAAHVEPRLYAPDDEGRYGGGP